MLGGAYGTCNSHRNAGDMCATDHDRHGMDGRRGNAGNAHVMAGDTGLQRLLVITMTKNIHASTVNRTRGLKIFSLALSQLSYQSSDYYFLSGAYIFCATSTKMKSRSPTPIVCGGGTGEATWKTMLAGRRHGPTSSLQSTFEQQ